MTCCRSKNDFCKKNQEVSFFALKCKTTLVPLKSAGTCAKFKKNTLKAAATKQELICVSQVVYYLCGVFFPSFDFMFGSYFTKIPYFGTLKMEKAFFVAQNKNRPPWRSSPSQGPHACSIWPHSDKLCHAHDRI
jgi:hypothetical protein